MVNIKKCPNCGKFSNRTGSREDRCEHCGALLDREEIEMEQELDERVREDEESSPFHIKETDSPLVKFFKKIGLAVEYVFMAILGFILWLLAMAPG